MSQENTVLVERKANGVALVRLNRPDSLNAFTVPMIGRLCSLLEELDRDEACQVIVLAAQGRGFCAGLDLKAASPAPGAERPGPIALMALQETFGAMPCLMQRIRQPVVAAVQGAAVGAGFALALAADVRIAGKSAKFLNGAIKIGLSAGETGMSYHLPRLVGAGRAFEIMLTGRTVLADEALQIGLVTQLVEDGQLLDAALKTAALIATNSPYSVKKTKQLMWQNLEAPSLAAAVQLENHVQTVALMTEDFAEATRAFVEKRPPNFAGK